MLLPLTLAVLDGMIEKKAGAIVSMGSDAGRMGEFREAVYGACKAGIIALSKSLAREVGRHGIRLNVVCPGMTMPSSEEEFGDLSMWAAEVNRAWGTPEMQARIAKAYPLRRIGKPDDVSKLGPLEKWTYKARNGQVVFVLVGDVVTLEAAGPPDKKD